MTGPSWHLHSIVEHITVPENVLGAMGYAIDHCKGMQFHSLTLQNRPSISDLGRATPSAISYRALLDDGCCY